MDAGPDIDLFLRHCLTDLIGGDFGTDYDPHVEEPPLSELLRSDGMAHFREGESVPIEGAYVDLRTSPFHRVREELRHEQKARQAQHPEVWD